MKECLVMMQDDKIDQAEVLLGSTLGIEVEPREAGKVAMSPKKVQELNE